ncbi:integrase, partial [Vitiosangium sp. GDMCC 1.1324]
AQDAEDWVLGLSAQQALRKAGVLSLHFWLHSLM